MRVTAFGYVCAVAFAGLLATAHTGARAAADKTLGMALLSAVVDQNGNLLYGNGAVSVQKPDTGFYVITFARSVANCTSVASGNTDQTIIRVGIFAGDDESVSAEDAAGKAKDAAFQLLVFCAK
ncbi:MAG TPA: hypothetical protein VGG69_07675 [Rhizomicrobium sp.]|jgi:hypothetical protein